jgi:hypothetical protein
MDTFDVALSNIFSQPGENKLCPINFCSCKFSLVEINYEIHDKLFLAIMDTFEEGHHSLKGAQHEIIVHYNNKNF